MKYDFDTLRMGLLIIIPILILEIIDFIKPSYLIFFGIGLILSGFQKEDLK